LIDGNRAVFSSNSSQVEKVDDTLPFFPFVTKTRQQLILLFEKALPEPESALLIGVVFGIKMPMSDSFFEALQQSGVLHVIAASGMNVVLVSVFLFTFHRIFAPRKVALSLTILGLFFYTVLSGLDPSIIRASIMAGIAITASLLGRQYTGGIVLVFTAYLMLFIHPSYLFSLGFQLSFLSTLSIMFIQPVLMTLTSGVIKRVPLIREDLLSTAAAQLGTNPLLLFTFGTINVLSILINALVLWTIPFLMVIGGVGALIGLLVPAVGGGILWLSLPFLSYFIMVVTTFGALHTSLTLSSFSVIALIGYYVLLIAGLVFLKTKYVKKNALE
jgi:competence protein ComEC